MIKAGLKGPVHVSIYSITVVVVAAKGGGGVEGGGGALEHQALSAVRFRAKRCAQRTNSYYLNA